MQRIVRNDKTKRLDQSGVAMVEAAIAIPCFLMLFLTTLQVTILVTAYISASEAAAVAARETAAAGGGTVDPFDCAAYARSQMQREMDRLVVPARATAGSSWSSKAVFRPTPTTGTIPTCRALRRPVCRQASTR